MPSTTKGYIFPYEGNRITVKIQKVYKKAMRVELPNGASFTIKSQDVLKYRPSASPDIQ